MNFLVNRKIKYEIDSNGCWNCTSHKMDDVGYPRFSFKNKCCRIYRIFYMVEALKVENLDKNIVIRHICDNPRCINLSHLVPGSQQDNVDDRNSKGRQARGENHGKTKLSNDDVNLIRQLYNSGIRTKDELAEIFEVHRYTVGNIINNSKRNV